MSRPRIDLVIRDAEVDGRRVDVSVAGASIASVEPAAGDHGGEAGRGRAARVVDARGGALIPGLHDHHIHLLALAAADRSLTLTQGSSLREIAADSGQGWLRVVGYHEAEHGPLDRHLLDELTGDRPARVQHQTGALWVLNSPALAAVGLADHPDGRLLGADALVRERVPSDAPDLAAIGRRLASFGLTGLTDATPTERVEDLDLLAGAAEAGALPQRLMVMGGPGLAMEARDHAAAGPVKIVIGDHELPALADVVAAIERARAADRPVAIHAVSRVGLILAVAAWEEAGATMGDRVEHGGVVPPELAEWLADHGVVVVTQPSFVRERGDRFLRDVEPDDVEHLYPCGRLLDAGVRVAGSSDAPFGNADPWQSITAAVERRTRSGALLGAHDRVAPLRALQMFLGDLDDPGGPPRRVVPGAPADLCLLHTRMHDALAAPSAALVRSVVCGGRIVIEPDT